MDSQVVSGTDRRTLRELGKRKAEIAALPVQDERRRLWAKLNDLDSQRPMVWLFEVPWNEMGVDDGLEPTCSHPYLRSFEVALRKELYQWDHMQGDMVVDPTILVPPAIGDTGFGLAEDVDIERTDETSSVVSRHFNIQIQDERDIDKIQMPKVTLHDDVWNANVDLLNDVFDGVIPVEKTGVKGTSIAPWDWLIRVTGVEGPLMDMVMRPDYVHRLMDRLTTAYMRRLDQYDELDILALNNERWLGGGPQFTDELPPPDCDPARIRTADMWGRTMSQIFSTVSPAMHEEFALQYECRYLERFGLTYYGCCEPLDKKVGILREHVPNLRKISMSPWIDLDVAANAMGTDYVFSLKHNPALLATEDWDADLVRRDLVGILERLRGMHVEIIMKDISTVCYEPQRLWEWARIASEVAETFAA
ncbi:MAG: hypothetical protein HN742_32850 [Lentisphaerae bacterium]|nr:hypothetical protein [Lentisphaerota bacterium]MBT4821812.1 hypothetical protein [Lentisphaerota bacterium]MBT5610902.1 hypothetical protein [Lentisphaerota bacterium]MBT7055899.1 hypothetical protein [Lentisphaerota bacterium]MBT7846706.1 hypothetical protein [Lentisphaerota bacterium]